MLRVAIFNFHPHILSCYQNHPKNLRNCWKSSNLNYDKIIQRYDQKHILSKNISKDKAQCDRLLGIAQDHCLEQLVTFPTRGKNTLDLCLTSSPGLNKTYPAPKMSDHETVVVDMNFKAKVNRRKPCKVYLYIRANWEGVEEDLCQFQEEYFTGLPDARSVDANWNLFKGRLQECIDKNTPSKLVRQRTDQPWISRNIRRAIRKKQRQYNHARKTGKDSNWAKFWSTRKIVQKEIQQS